MQREVVNSTNNIENTRNFVVQNPVHGSIFLELGDQWTDDIQIILHDMSGRELINVDAQNGGNDQTINESHIPTGVYSISVLSASHRATQKVYIQN